MVSRDLKCLVLVWSYLLEEFFKNLAVHRPPKALDIWENLLLEDT